MFIWKKFGEDTLFVTFLRGFPFNVDLAIPVPNELQMLELTDVTIYKISFNNSIT